MKQQPKKHLQIGLLKPLLFTLSLLLLGGIMLKGENFKIPFYKVHIDISNTNYFEVEETIQVQFTSPRHGITRTLPLIRDNRQIAIELLRVEDWNFTIDRNDKRLKVRIGETNKLVDKEQTYVIRYRVSNAFQHHLFHTVFSWNLVGAGWDVPIDLISYKIIYPPSIDLPKEEVSIQTGNEFSIQSKATIFFRDNTVFGNSTHYFLPNEGMTIRMKLPKGKVSTFKTIQLLKQAGRIVLGFIPALIFLLLWWFQGRNKKYVITPHAYPPKDISPAEAGAILEEGKYDSRLLTSLIPYWGANGIIQMNVIHKNKEKQDAQLIKKRALSSNRPYYEQVLFFSIFEKSNSILLSTLKGQLGVKMNKATKLLQEEVKSDKFYSTFSIQYLKHYLPFILSTVLIVIGIWLLLFQHDLLLGLSLLFGAYFGLILKNKMLKRNDKGQTLHEQINGFKAFIIQAGPHEIKQLIKENASYLQEIFPYVVALGRKEMLAKKLKNSTYENIDWYHADSPNDTTISIELLSDQLTVLDDTFSSEPTLPKPVKRKRFFGKPKERKFDFSDYDEDDWDNDDESDSFFDTSDNNTDWDGSGDDKDGGGSW